MASRKLKQSKVAKALLWLSLSRPEENAFQMILVHQLDINQWHSDLERKFLCASQRGKEESTTCITLWASNTSCWLRSMNKRNVIHFSWVNKTFLSRRIRSHSVAFKLTTFTFQNRFYFRWKCLQKFFFPSWRPCSLDFLSRATFVQEWRKKRFETCF